MSLIWGKTLPVYFLDNRLFLDNIEPIDEYYRMVRDDTREEIIKGKEFMEELWEQYYEYADKDFPKKLSEDFHARFWEMYPTYTLIKRGYPVCPKAARSEGPDILIQDSKNTIYIEAVTPSEGHEDNVDKVPKMQMMKATRVSDEQITLRYCGVISEKHKKYISYLEKRVITNSDAYIIAVNSCKIEQAIIETDVPRIMKAILPIGYEQVTISRIPGSEASWHHQYRNKINRSKGSSVNTDIFLNQYYEGLSGVIYTRTDLFNRPPLMGDNYIFVHNPLAQNHIPNGFFNFGTEYYIELKPGSFSFHCKKWE